MIDTLSYQLYKCEHGVSAAEQRAVYVRTGEAAAVLRDLRLRLARAFLLRRRVRPLRRAAGVMIASAASVRVLSGVR